MENTFYIPKYIYLNDKSNKLYSISDSVFYAYIINVDLKLYNRLMLIQKLTKHNDILERLTFLYSNKVSIYGMIEKELNTACCIPFKYHDGFNLTPTIMT